MLFYGFSPILTCPAIGCGRLADTWEYDGTDWKQINTPHQPPTHNWISIGVVPGRTTTTIFLPLFTEYLYPHPMEEVIPWP